MLRLREADRSRLVSAGAAGGSSTPLQELRSKGGLGRSSGRVRFAPSRRCFSCRKVTEVPADTSSVKRRSGEVTILHRAQEGVVELVCGSASYRLDTYAAEDFPRLPEIEDASAFTSKEAFVDTIARVSRSASRDESRPFLTGVLVRFEGDKLVMAATESYELSVNETALSDPPVARLRPAASLPCRAKSA